VIDDTPPLQLGGGVCFSSEGSQVVIGLKLLRMSGNVAIDIRRDCPKFVRSGVALDRVASRANKRPVAGFVAARVVHAIHGYGPGAAALPALVVEREATARAMRRRIDCKNFCENGVVERDKIPVPGDASSRAKKPSLQVDGAGGIKSRSAAFQEGDTFRCAPPNFEGGPIWRGARRGSLNTPHFAVRLAAGRRQPFLVPLLAALLGARLGIVARRARLAFFGMRTLAVARAA
jgi:hypothetical protein